MARSALLNIMTAAAIKAGRTLARDFGEIQNLQTSLKGPQNYAERTRGKVESILHSELSKARPGYSFLLQNSHENDEVDKDNIWITSALDGFTSFLHGLSFFCVSVALQRQGNLVASTLYNPVNGELYTAERGNGTFMNDRRLRVAGRLRLQDSMIGIGVAEPSSTLRPAITVNPSKPIDPAPPISNECFPALKNILLSAASFCCPGSTALGLAWVAAGRIDGFWQKTSSLSSLGAGTLLVKEAGGFVSTIKSCESFRNS